MVIEGKQGSDQNHLAEPETKAIDMEAFWSEVEQMVEDRLKPRDESDPTAPDDMFDLKRLDRTRIKEDLTEVDAAMWDRIKGAEALLITQDEIDAYGREVADSENTTRKFFKAAIMNRLQHIHNAKERQRLGF